MRKGEERERKGEKRERERGGEERERERKREEEVRNKTLGGLKKHIVSTQNKGGREKQVCHSKI